MDPTAIVRRSVPGVDPIRSVLLVAAPPGGNEPTMILNLHCVLSYSFYGPLKKYLIIL